MALKKRALPLIRMLMNPRSQSLRQRSVASRKMFHLYRDGEEASKKFDFTGQMPIDLDQSAFGRRPHQRAFL